MFCYNCSAANNDGVKFCRSCGANLDTVTSALAAKPTAPKDDAANEDQQQPKTAQDWVAKRGKAVGQIVSGAIYTCGSFLLPLLAYLLLRDRGLVFVVFLCVSWILFTGLGSLAKGITAVMESNMVLQGLNTVPKSSSSGPMSALPVHAGDQRGIDTGGLGRAPLPPGASVTESTTRLLDDQPNR
jgi:hypothetical protein